MEKTEILLNRLLVIQGEIDKLNSSNIKYKEERGFLLYELKREGKKFVDQLDNLEELKEKIKINEDTIIRLNNEGVEIEKKIRNRLKDVIGIAFFKRNSEYGNELKVCLNGDEIKCEFVK